MAQRHVAFCELMSAMYDVALQWLHERHDPWAMLPFSIITDITAVYHAYAYGRSL